MEPISVSQRRRPAPQALAMSGNSVTGTEPPLWNPQGNTNLWDHLLSKEDQRLYLIKLAWIGQLVFDMLLEVNVI